MDERELRDLLEQAQEALRRGDYTYNEVNAVIREVTGGQINGLMSLTLAVDPTTRAEEFEATALREATAHSPVSNFARLFAQGATLGFGDELAGIGAGIVPGGQTREEATADSRKRLDALRTTNPGASLLAEGAGIAATAPLGGQAFTALRGPGGFVRGVKAAAVVGGTEGALIGAGGAEGDLVERAPAAARGGAAGATAGLLASGVGGVIGAGNRAIGGLFRGPEVAARRSLSAPLRGSGLTAQELPGAVARLGDDAVLADLPTFGAQAPGAVRSGPRLMRQGGPVERLRARLAPEQIRAAQRAIFKPLEDANVAVDDPNLLRFLRSNPETNAALGEVFGSPSGIRSMNFREIQAVRQVLSRRMARADRLLATEVEDTARALDGLDSILADVIPGFRPALQQSREVIQRVEGQQQLQAAIDRAFPSFEPGIPSASISEIRGEMFNIPTRREAVAEMVGEMLLEPGGAERAAELLRTGFFAKAFKDLRSVGRQVGQTEVGRVFGSTVENGRRPGLLSLDEEEDDTPIFEPPPAASDATRVAADGTLTPIPGLLSAFRDSSERFKERNRRAARNLLPIGVGGRQPNPR